MVGFIRRAPNHSTTELPLLIAPMLNPTIGNTNVSGSCFCFVVAVCPTSNRITVQQKKLSGRKCPLSVETSSREVVQKNYFSLFITSDKAVKLMITLTKISPLRTQFIALQLDHADLIASRLPSIG